MPAHDPFVVTTIINIQPSQLHELKSASKRVLGLLTLQFIWKHLLRPQFGCQHFLAEEYGCDVLLTNCTRPPLRPNACIESKYVENFWLRRGVLLQKVKDARYKLRRAHNRGFKNRFLLVSSFAIKRHIYESNKLFKEERQYVIVVLLMKSKIVEEDPPLATQEIVSKAEELTEEESLDPIANLAVNMLYDKFNEFEEEQKDFEKRIEERQERIEERQERIEKKLQMLQQDQKLLRKGQKKLVEEVVELKNLVIEVLKRLDKE